jgi:DNA-binding MarR family transcriptional regulator
LRTKIAGADSHLSLCALLSRALVAFIIEFDNEFEHRMPHRTTNFGSNTSARGAPWLVSMAMWLMFMRFIPEEGVALTELRSALGMDAKSAKLWLARMGKWWGYVVVESGVVRPRAFGLQAQAIWGSLTTMIEKRWEERFGQNEIDRLREVLREIVSRLPGELPDSLPILGYGLFSRCSGTERSAPFSELTLPLLLSKVLLAFALEFEGVSEVSLAISANVLRLGERANVKDLPKLSGVSKEAVAMSVSFLQKRGYATIETESRVKVLTLTPKGKHAREEYFRLVSDIERRWEATYGRNTIAALRELLTPLSGHVAAPYPDCWRASVPQPEGLPHYPMILHRGGFPDGS